MLPVASMDMYSMVDEHLKRLHCGLCFSFLSAGNMKDTSSHGPTAICPLHFLRTCFTNSSHCHGLTLYYSKFEVPFNEWHLEARLD